MKRRGLRVAPFKVGPDFIDPGHHTHVTGRVSRNLDGWMLSKSDNQSTFRRHKAGCDVAVVEGVMGLFDGHSGQSEAGSTAEMAKWLDLPVLLVVNAASMARSAAALVQGFERFDPAVRFVGVVFNHLGSPGHLKYLEEAMAAYVAMPLLGGLSRNDGLRVPERHLGLATAEDHPLSPDQVDRLADAVETGLNLDRLLGLLPEIRNSFEAPSLPVTLPSRRVRVGVARDRAFCFYYPENLELLEAAGAEVVFFSPLTDTDLPAGIDGLYLGGGYPELHAQVLADNHRMREAIHTQSLRGMPIYGECGGFMVLCRELEDVEGRLFPMCGCFPFKTRMQSRLKALGYREVTLTDDTVLGKAGRTIRGHEFHYSALADPDPGKAAATVYSVAARAGGHRTDEGYLVHRTLGSYVHLHFGSRPECAEAFADACRTYRKERGERP